MQPPQSPSAIKTAPRCRNNCALLLCATFLLCILAMLCACQAASHTRYSTSVNIQKQDLVKLSNADATGHILYLNRYSIQQDRKKKNWRHATLISSIPPDSQPVTPRQQLSTSMEVTLDCENRKISIDLSRTHPNPLAQGDPISTQAFNNGFLPIRDLIGTANQRLYKEVCR